MSIERGCAEDPTDDRPVELESVRDDQGRRGERHAPGDVANERQGVPVAASPGASAINCYSGGQTLVPDLRGRQPARPDARDRADAYQY